MAFYRNVQMTFWTDTKITDDFTPEDKYFYLYLFTNPHTNLCGCYELSKRQVAMETGYHIETIEKLLERFENTHNVLHYDHDTKEVLLINWHKYNWTKSADFKKAIVKEIRCIKNNDFRDFLLDIFTHYETVPRPSLDGGGTTDTVTVTDTVSVTVTDTDNTKGPKKRKNARVFVPPTLEQVNAYIKEKGLQYVVGKEFIDYFTESNWIDSNGNPVKSWKSKLLVWEKFNSIKAKEKPKQQDYMQGSLADDLSAIEAAAMKGGNK